MKTFFVLSMVLGLFILNATPALAQKTLLFSSGAGAMSGMLDIAIAKSFIEGQKAEMKVFKNGREALNAFLEGQVDIGTTSANSIVASNGFDPKKHAIVAILSYTDSQLKLLTRNASGIRKISDLKGKTIATPGFSNQYILSKLLNYNGISTSEVTFVKLKKAQLPPAIASGQVDAIFQHGKPIKDAKKLLGDGGWMLFQNPNIERKKVVLLMNRNMIKSSPELVEKVLRAVLKAQDFYQKNQAECITIVGKSKKYTFQQMESAMNEIDYRLSLRQSLLLTMETIDKWGVDNNFFSRSEQINYYEYIDPKPLSKVDSDLVTIIH
jgi:ABC-type nitrate/sulfonate/bicarbonate transport system substrate-binding protein